MAYPTKPSIQTSYTAVEQALGDGTLPGQELDNDLANLKTSLDALNDFVRGVTRSDGKLANQSVSRETLGPDISLGFGAPTEWTPSRTYLVSETVFSDNGFYICAIAHTSGAVFATDLAASRWELLVDFAGVQAGAEAAQTGAQAALAEFRTRYLGAAASDPATNLVGGALIDGAAYFNTGARRLKIYDLATTAWYFVAPTAAEQANINIVATNVADVTNFADVYIGPAASDPALRSDGTALQAGDLYFNTASGSMRVYNGAAWVGTASAVNGTSRRQSFTATAGQTVFTVTGGYDAGFADVYLNGVKLVNGVDVAVTSGTNVVLTVGAALDDSVDVVAYGTFNLANTYTQAEADALFGGQGYAIGDAVETFRSLAAPEFIPANGAYLRSSFPDLSPLVPPKAPNDKLANPATLPTTTGKCAVFSADGTYLVVGTDGTPFIAIYKRSGDTFTRLANPATLTANRVNGASFSPDGTYLACAHTVSPHITIYKRSGDVFTKLADPATVPIQDGNGASFSPDGTYLAVAHTSTPFVTIYKRSGDVFTKLADPATLPTGNGFGTAFSADGTYLSVAHNVSPFVTIYKRSGDVFTKLANPASLPTGDGKSTAFSPDGTHLAVAHETIPRIAIYKRSGDVFTKLADPSSLPTGTSRGAAFSADGNYLALAFDATPFVATYKRSGDVFNKLSNPAALPAGPASGVGFSTDGSYLAVSHATSPFVTIYKGDIPTEFNLSSSPTISGANVFIKAT